MTRSDYEMVARELRHAITRHKNHDNNAQAYALFSFAHDLAGAFAHENMAFDRAKFLRECGCDT